MYVTSSSNEIIRYARTNIILFCPAIVLCLPLLDEITSRVLIELDGAWQTYIQSSTILMIHTEDIDPFLPKDELPPANLSTLARSTIQSSNFFTSNVTHAGTDATLKGDERARTLQGSRHFAPPRNLSGTTLENLLAVAPLDQR